MKKGYLLLLVTLLAGCTEYRWVKPGADERQRNIEETACRAQALRDLQPDNVVLGKYESKDKKHRSSDTSYYREDANEDAREILIKDCMYRKGWSQVEVRN